MCLEITLGFGALLETLAVLSRSSTWASTFLSAYQEKCLAALRWSNEQMKAPPKWGGGVGGVEASVILVIPHLPFISAHWATLN